MIREAFAASGEADMTAWMDAHFPELRKMINKDARHGLDGDRA